MHQRGLGFIKFFLEGGGVGVLLFSINSHHISQHVPNSSSLYPIINIFNLLQIFVKAEKMGYELQIVN